MHGDDVFGVDKLKSVRAVAPGPRWNGQLVRSARRCTIVVAQSPLSPNHWSTEEGLVGQEIIALEVITDYDSFYLDDRRQDASRKLRAGIGSPVGGYRHVHVQRVVSYIDEENEHGPS